MSGVPHLGESVEMYLKTIAELGGGRDLVPVTGIAEQLKISTVSASEMVHRMQEHNLVVHTPYKGVQLTQSGIRKANGVIRRHRLWERFLIDKLQLPWDRAYEYACALEHATDDELADALGDFLGNPATCPHGNPVPAKDGTVAELDGELLSSLAPGDGGTILRIDDANGELLAYLDQRQFDPGKHLVIREIAPFNGPITVLMNGDEHVLGREVAAHVVISVE